MTDSDFSSLVGKKFVARCKWFNSKLGYGFVTLVLDSNNDKVDNVDLFCHHSNIKPSVSTFKTLYQGEYVSCCVSRCPESVQGQEFQVEEVTGVGGEQLMVDTRELSFDSRNGENRGRGGRGRGGRGGRGGGRG